MRGSRSDPGLKPTRLCRWPVAWLVMKAGSGNDLDGENHGDEPVDGGAERRPPPCPGDVVAALLPEVLETVACVTQDQQPGRSGDARRGQQDERAGDAALHGDYLGSSVCHREPDVDRCDQGEQQSLDGCLVEPPQGERRRGLDGAECQPPQNRYTYRMLPLRGKHGCGYGRHRRFRWVAAAGRNPAPMAAARVRAAMVVGRHGHAGPASRRWLVGYSMDLAVMLAVARSAWAARSRSIASKLNSPSACGSSMSRPRPAAQPASRGSTWSARWTPGTISRSTRGAAASAGAATRRSPWRVVTVRPAAIGTVRAANELA